MSHRALALATCTALLAVPLCGQMQSLAISRSPQQEEQSLVVPPPLRGVGFTQRLGEAVPLDLRFTDSSGTSVRLGDTFGERPVLLAPVYFECPMLCSLVLDGVVRSLKPLSFDPGNEMEVVVVSFDPDETPQLAAEARTTALSRYDREQAEGGWRFLTGDAESVAALMDSIGFDYRRDDESGQYAHAGGIVLLTAGGKISRYFFGVDYPPNELRLALVEASRNQIGSLVDKVFLFCFRYDPSLGRYSATILNILKLGGVLTMILVAAFLFLMWRFERSRTGLPEANAG